MRADLGLHVSLFLPDGHFAVVKQAFEFVLDAPGLLPELLPEDVYFVLQLCSLCAHALHLAAPRVANLGFQLGACRAEQVCFVLDVRLGHQALACEHHVLDQDPAHRFHKRHALLLRVRGFRQLAHQPVGVEVVHVWWCFQVRRFVLFF